MHCFRHPHPVRHSGILAGMAAVFVSLSSCERPFDISSYEVKLVESYPGTLSSGTVLSNPSIAVLVDGPAEREWKVEVGSGDLAGTEALAVTGRRVEFPVRGLSAERPEALVSVVVRDHASGEVLSVRRRLRIYLEDLSKPGGDGGTDGPDVPPVVTPSLVVSSLTLLVGGPGSSVSETALSLADGQPSFEVQKGCSGSLVVGYACSGDDGLSVSLDVRTEDGALIKIPDGSVTRSASSFTIPFRAISEGSGRLEITLTGEKSSASVLIGFTVLPDGRVIEFVPDTFTFAEQNEAKGTIKFMGFPEGERCDVVLCYKERDSGDEGKSEYRDVDTGIPLRVLLWEAGGAASWHEVSYWAELYAPGETEAFYVTPVTKVYPFRPEFLWWQEDGTGVREGSPVRSTASGAVSRLAVVTGSHLPGHITQVVIRDSRQGKSYTATSPERDTDGYYVFEMVHPKKGEHTFSVTFVTDEGDYRYSFGKRFCDVWTVIPFVDGSSLYADLRGPELTLDTRCELEIFVDIYAVFDYTIAMERNGQKTDEPTRWWHYIETRGLDYIIPSGTAQVTLKIQSGWVNTSLRHIKSVAGGLPWSVTGGTATRWVKNGNGGMTAMTYTPAASKPGVLLALKADSYFYGACNDIVLDYSKLKGTLDSNGFVY